MVELTHAPRVDALLDEVAGFGHRLARGGRPGGAVRDPRPAAGFLFPLQWDESFGMVMIEALATGTPVLTLDRGAAPEIVADGVTGYVRSRPDELVEAIGQLSRISPEGCRACVEELFSPQHLVDGYERIYREVVAS